MYLKDALTLICLMHALMCH